MSDVKANNRHVILVVGVTLEKQHSSGSKIIEIPNADETLNAIQTCQPTLVVLNQAAAHLSSQIKSESPLLPIIVISGHKESVIKVGMIEMHQISRRVKHAGNAVELTVKEFALLEYLLLNVNKVLTRKDILQRVWGENSEKLTNIVDVYINYLRKKLAGSSIKTVRGLGYMIETSHQTAQVA